MTYTIRVVLDTKKLEAIAAKLDSNTHEVVGIVAREVEQGTKAGAPVDTGALRNSIMTKPEKQNTWIVHDGVTYGVYQELGTSRGITPKYFMTRACQAAEGRFNSGALWKDLFG